MATYNLWTVGCQMNKADSDRLASGLEKLGLLSCDVPEDSDVVVLNTCVVRQSAEDTATGLLGRLKPIKMAHPNRTIAVMGCMVGPTQDKLRRRFPHVDVWARPQQFEPVIQAAAARIGLNAEGCLDSLVPKKPGVTAFVPIVHGCDKFCTFCIIPYRRGRETSRSTDEIVRETALLAQRGVREVTLLGQNVDSYGQDLSPRRDLADLLYEVHAIEGLERIRFLTSHPNDMSSRIIRAVADLPKVCESVNLPVQAGDDAILADMKRGYTRRQYLDKVKEIRETIPAVTMTTDLIVGFPGESREQFRRSLELLQEVRFDKVHAAAYSERPGTLASRRLPDTLDRTEKKGRLAEVSRMQEQIQNGMNKRLAGQKFEVLVDNRTRGRLQGRTRGDKIVYLQGEDSMIGQTVTVRITDATPWSLRGEVQEAGKTAAPPDQETNRQAAHNWDQQKLPAASTP